MASKRRSYFSFMIFLAALGVGGGCDTKWVEYFKGSSVTPVPRSSENAESRARWEILREIFAVVLFQNGAEPTAQMQALYSSLEQGASFEGIYNGLTHSAAYRELEKGTHASDLSVHLFCEELISLEGQALRLGRWGPSAAEPLHPPVDPSVDVGISRGGEADIDPAGLSRNCRSWFSASSLFTLKRVLGDEALKLIDEKKKSAPNLASWYSEWVVRMANKKIDFGLSLRNSPDVKLHREWAVSASEDRLKWEVLNRVHRLLNAN